MWDIGEFRHFVQIFGVAGTGPVDFGVAGVAVAGDSYNVRARKLQVAGVGFSPLPDIDQRAIIGLFEHEDLFE